MELLAKPLRKLPFQDRILSLLRDQAYMNHAFQIVIPMQFTCSQNLPSYLKPYYAQQDN